jgi:hypothetical protein
MGPEDVCHRLLGGGFLVARHSTCLSAALAGPPDASGLVLTEEQAFGPVVVHRSPSELSSDVPSAPSQQTAQEA